MVVNYSEEHKNVHTSTWNDYAANDSTVTGYVKETNLSAADLTINAGSGKVTFNGDVGASKALNNLTIETTGGVSAAKTIHTENSIDVEAGTVSFDGMATAGKTTKGDIIKSNEGKITIATKDKDGITTNGVDASGKVLLSSSVKGTITLASGTVQSSAVGDNEAVVIGTGGSFVNKAGAQAVKANGAGSYWKIFSAEPATDEFGDLDSAFCALWSTPYTTEAVGKEAADSYNRYIFAYTPTITVTANDASKAYGAESTGNGYTASIESFADYTSAFQEPANIISSLGVSLSSYGFPASAAVNTYAIDPSGVAATATGYAVSYIDGTLTVTDNGTSPVNPNPNPTPEPTPTPTPTPEPTPEPTPTPTPTPEPTPTPTPEPTPSAATVSTVKLDYRDTSNTAGLAAMSFEGPSNSVIQVLPLQTADLPFFKVANRQVSNYGTYNVTENPDEVKLTPTAKRLPEPNKEKTQYRALDKSFDLTEGTGKFSMVYNGTTFNIYPADENAKALLLAGDPQHNVEIETKALFSSFKDMGLVLENFDAIYVHIDKTEAEANQA